MAYLRASCLLPVLGHDEVSVQEADGAVLVSVQLEGPESLDFGVTAAAYCIVYVHSMRELHAAANLGLHSTMYVSFYIILVLCRLHRSSIHKRAWGTRRKPGPVGTNPGVTNPGAHT